MINMRTIKYSFIIANLLLLLFTCCNPSNFKSDQVLTAILDKDAATISVFTGNKNKPILVQNAKSGFRPYLHPIVAPDGKGLLTENSPEHHAHQTGLYWGFTRVNGKKMVIDSLMNFFYEPKTEEQKAIKGRDYFHNPGKEYWKRLSFDIIDSIGSYQPELITIAGLSLKMSKLRDMS